MMLLVKVRYVTQCAPKFETNGKFFSLIAFDVTVDYSYYFQPTLLVNRNYSSFSGEASDRL